MEELESVLIAETKCGDARVHGVFVMYIRYSSSQALIWERAGRLLSSCSNLFNCNPSLNNPSTFDDFRLIGHDHRQPRSDSYPSSWPLPSDDQLGQPRPASKIVILHRPGLLPSLPGLRRRAGLLRVQVARAKGDMLQRMSRMKRSSVNQIQLGKWPSSLATRTTS